MTRPAIAAARSCSPPAAATATTRRSRPAAAATIVRARAGAIATAESATVDRPLSLPSQLYVEHDAAVLARSSGVVESDPGRHRHARWRPASCSPGSRAPTRRSPSAQAREQAANASQRVERQRALATAGVVTRADSEQVEFEHRAADLALRKAQRDYDLTRIMAPFDGVVTARMARVQRLVQPGDSLFRVTALAPVLATVRVPESGRGRPPGRARRRGCSPPAARAPRPGWCAPRR